MFHCAAFVALHAFRYVLRGWGRGHSRYVTGVFKIDRGGETELHTCMQVVPFDRSRNTAQQAHALLRQWILTGKLRPGEAISEPSIAEKLGISRTPVREVFKRLEAEGLVEIFPQVGTIVAPIDPAKVGDAQFVRETLEVRTIGLAAVQGSAEQHKMLKDILARQKTLVKARDIHGFMESDDALHEQLSAMAGHPFSWQVIAAAKAQLDRVRYLSLTAPSWLAMIYDEHCGIVDAVIARDAARARLAMEHHQRSIFSAVERLTQQDPWLVRTADKTGTPSSPSQSGHETKRGKRS